MLWLCPLWQRYQVRISSAVGSLSWMLESYVAEWGWISSRLNLDWLSEYPPQQFCNRLGGLLCYRLFSALSLSRVRNYSNFRSSSYSVAILHMWLSFNRAWIWTFYHLSLEVPSFVRRYKFYAFTYSPHQFVLHFVLDLYDSWLRCNRHRWRPDSGLLFLTLIVREIL